MSVGAFVFLAALLGSREIAAGLGDFTTAQIEEETHQTTSSLGETQKDWTESCCYGARGQVATAAGAAAALTRAVCARMQAATNLPSALLHVAALPAMTAEDPGAPAGSSTSINCTAPMAGPGAPPTRVTAGVTEFPHGTTAVTCTAKDSAGNGSPAVAFVVVVACGSGYSLYGNPKACRSECGRRPLLFQ
jgi:hypothetical protein